jgi:hypothetical protein
MPLPIPLHARPGRSGARWPPDPLLDPPEPTPLPGDLRIAQFRTPGISRHLAGRWQIQVYDADAGRWRAYMAAEEWRTFAAEADALEHLLAFVQRGRP